MEMDKEVIEKHLIGRFEEFWPGIFKDKNVWNYQIHEHPHDSKCCITYVIHKVPGKKRDG